MTGEVVYFFAFDVANEILLTSVQQQLGGRARVFAPRAKHSAPRGVALYRPVAITPPALSVELAGQPLRLEMRLYEFGVVSIVMRVDFQKDSLSELYPFHQPILSSGQPLDLLAKTLCTDLCREIEPFLVRPSGPTEPEAYTAFCLYELGTETDAEAWLTAQRADVAGLLTALEPQRLSTRQIDEVFRLQRAQERIDAVVIDWDAALVIDLSRHADDVLFAIELANLQLEEFRHMDMMLDRFLNQAYDDLERRTFSLLGASSAVLRKLRWFRVDLAKLADEVTNTTKVFGDWYLARVYLAARERFHLDPWRHSVDQRLAQLDQIYNVVHSEVAERRMFWVEMVIVTLIALDLLAIFLRK